LQHTRRTDPLAAGTALEEVDEAAVEAPGTEMDIDRALARLPAAVRLCIVLSYQERMSHAEIAEWTGIALGTVKSHIRRGTERLQLLLADYAGEPRME
jgi:RNA polymerase sigma-70 factor (ECF subfamily)